MAKLFSLTMLQHIDVWVEDEGMRAAGKVGFWHGGVGTLDYICFAVIEKFQSLRSLCTQYMLISGSHMIVSSFQWYGGVSGD